MPKGKFSLWMNENNINFSFCHSLNNKEKFRKFRQFLYDFMMLNVPSPLHKIAVVQFKLRFFCLYVIIVILKTLI